MNAIHNAIYSIADSVLETLTEMSKNIMFNTDYVIDARLTITKATVYLNDILNDVGLHDPNDLYELLCDYEDSWDEDSYFSFAENLIAHVDYEAERRQKAGLPA